MHIDRIKLKDVGPFDDVTIEFPPGTDPKLADVYLLTGPNGSGKSTVLYAIAAAIGGGFETLGQDFVRRRLRTQDAMAVLGAGDLRLAVTNSGDPREEVPDPLGSAVPLGSWRGVTDEAVGYLDNLTRLQKVRYAPMAARFQHAFAHLRPSFSWAAFAYAGIRSLGDGHVTAIQAPQHSPFDNSLSFVQTADTSVLVNWIANQQFRRLKAKDAGHDERAEQMAQSVRDIERVVARIVDDPDFAFATNDEDNDVRARWQGVVVDLGLLPDGLKSIMSWIADLLMRLDRIPWVDNTPVTQRSFLLLLDEVDIHLHPSWQRKVLPLVQRLFPNAQIIASTHSPFVVASVADARIITLALHGRSSVVEATEPSMIGVSYSAVLRSIFGIDSEFDVDTEQALRWFREAKARLLAGDAAARAEVDRLAADLAGRSEEVRDLIGLELGQLKRQLGLRAAP